MTPNKIILHLKIIKNFRLKNYSNIFVTNSPFECSHIADIYATTLIINIAGHGPVHDVSQAHVNPSIINHTIHIFVSPIIPKTEQKYPTTINKTKY